MGINIGVFFHWKGTEKNKQKNINKNVIYYINKCQTRSLMSMILCMTRNQALGAWFQNSRCLFTENILLIILKIVKKAYISCSSSLFGVAAVAIKASSIKNLFKKGRKEKTNKLELWNRLTCRVLIHIFEVGMKTFFLK